MSTANTVEFDWREDEMTGEEGWILKDHPNFNASRGFGISHDVLEHFHEEGDDDSVRSELQAMGAFYFIRYLSGVIYRNVSFRTQEEIFGSELADMITRKLSWEEELKKPPITRESPNDDEYLAEFLRTARQHAKETLKRYYGDDISGMSMAQIDKLLVDMCHWVRIGYRRAIKRYRGHDEHEVGLLFDRLTDAVQKYSRGDYYPGDVLKIQVFPQKLDFKIVLKRPKDDY